MSKLLSLKLRLKTSCFHGNTHNICYQNKTLNYIWRGKNQRLLWELNETHKFKLHGQSRLLFSVKSSCTHNCITL
jgi:hypothetical protein